MSVAELEKELEGGSRVNRYRLNITLPTGVPGDVRKLSVLVKSTNVPGKTRGVINILREGITRRIAGDSVANESFPVLFNVPKNGSTVYNTVYNWYKLPETSNDYKADMTIEQLDIQNAVSSTWNVKGCWVSVLPAVSFNSESNDTLLEFEATFTLDDIELV